MTTVLFLPQRKLVVDFLDQIDLILWDKNELITFGLQASNPPRYVPQAYSPPVDSNSRYHIFMEASAYIFNSTSFAKVIDAYVATLQNVFVDVNLSELDQKCNNAQGCQSVANYLEAYGTVKRLLGDTDIVIFKDSGSYPTKGGEPVGDSLSLIAALNSLLDAEYDAYLVGKMEVEFVGTNSARTYYTGFQGWPANNRFSSTVFSAILLWVAHPQ